MLLFNNPYVVKTLQKKCIMLLFNNPYAVKTLQRMKKKKKKKDKQNV